MFLYPEFHLFYMDAILKKIKKKITPSKREYLEIQQIIQNIKSKINSIAKDRNYKVEVFIGGSVGKDTWLPNLHDIDFFLRFDYKKYYKQDEKISNYSEEILLNCFEQVLRLHGSRDYFQTTYKNYDLEFVPTLKISKPKQAKNITDASPLHVLWSKKKFKKNKGINTEIRLAKKFFKAAKVYGAESYINGFSGHVIDILTIYYGSFKNLVNAIDGWEKGMIIDIENHYKTRKTLFNKMNNSKTYGPMIVVDPIQPKRNCAAALNNENFNKIKKCAAKFLKNPTEDAFKEKEISLSSLKTIAKKQKKKLVYIEAEPEYENQDVAGAKIIKHFNYLLKQATLNNFEISAPDWEWNKDPDSKFRLWFFTNRKSLPKKKILWGPPITAKKEFIKSFKSKHSIQKIKKKKNKFYVEVPQLYQRIDTLISELDNHPYFRNFTFRIYNG